VSEALPHGPTSSSRPDARSHGDGPPPAPPRELPRAEPVERRFEHDGRTWVARLSGKSAWGTGSYGLGLVDAVHFADAERPDLPLHEVLLAHGRFDTLFDSELVALLRVAVPIAQER
jgi:hypothetical protein